jgi:hypothetical protein
MTDFQEQTYTMNDDGFGSDEDIEDDEGLVDVDGIGGAAISDEIDLFDSSQRIAELEKLYQLMRPGWFKAKAAYVLGHYYSSSPDGALHDYGLAERMLFECLYLLDHHTGIPLRGLPPIVSQLATSALLSYAEVLLRNCKYTYAILAYNAALTTYQLRQKREPYYSLLVHLADIARVHNDHVRALAYLDETLQKYSAENKINEVRASVPTTARLTLLALGNLRVRAGEQATGRGWAISFRRNTFAGCLCHLAEASNIFAH